MSTAGAPAGDGNYPVSKEYGGHALLSDHTAYFMSSFTPQFNWFLARGYQDNSFYREMNTRWLKADKLFWSNTLTETSTIWGTPVRNRSWQLDKPTNLIVEILFYYYYICIMPGCGVRGRGRVPPATAWRRSTTRGRTSSSRPPSWPASSPTPTPSSSGRRSTSSWSGCTSSRSVGQSND